MTMHFHERVIISKVSLMEEKHIHSLWKIPHFQQPGFLRMQHGHLGLNLSSAELCHKTWDPPHKQSSEGSCLVILSGKVLKVHYKQSDQIRIGTSWPAPEVLHKLLHTLNTYTPYTSWSPCKHFSAPKKWFRLSLVESTWHRYEWCEMYDTKLQ